MNGKLVLKDSTQLEGMSFGAPRSIAGEVVFATGMVGYPESLTDPSYRGQILVMTYPLIGNYGVPEKKHWESRRIQIAGLVVSNYIDTPSHHQSTMTLGRWLKNEGIPALEIKDTRFLTQKIRSEGAMLGSLLIPSPRGGGLGRGEFEDPNLRNLVAEVSVKKPKIEVPASAKASAWRGKTVVLIDCGAKANIARSLIARHVRVITVPWDYNIAKIKKFHGLIVSNGPGDPKMADKTITTVRQALGKKIPILGICLGNQILALAAGGNTTKLKFGHRGQNQPCRLVGSNKFYLTTQNHGFVVSKIPAGFKSWFVNANDGTNEGMIHKKLPFMSVQFHPEATPGPTDTQWIFDHFLKKLRA